jgi:hypothetical protein
MDRDRLQHGIGVAQRPFDLLSLQVDLAERRLRRRGEVQDEIVHAGIVFARNAGIKVADASLGAMLVEAVADSTGGPDAQESERASDT